ncbi:hypothetical protein EVAR_86343_1 [Eumeta japonica]|uniref:Uncharacterized protein n=1 Tax=Eumeta variegata TaxID=151549 RepID=A0A4C1X392_EUMVA|nr:hypothetical protein EVAR_86343_1 [Eumeta japonica]
MPEEGTATAMSDLTRIMAKINDMRNVFSVPPPDYSQALLLIEDMCYVMCGSLLVRLGMPAPDLGKNDAFNRELERKRDYDRHELSQSVDVPNHRYHYFNH